MLGGMHVLFFFSSRRRHTRCSRDWSSDVCSSDLWSMVPAVIVALLILRRMRVEDRFLHDNLRGDGDYAATVRHREVGRAACRERVEISGGGGSFKKKIAKAEGVWRAASSNRS